MPELQHLQPAQRAPGEDAANADAHDAAALVRISLGQEDADDAGVSDGGGVYVGGADEQTQEDERGDGGGGGPLRGADGLHQAIQEESRSGRRYRVKFFFVLTR